MIYAAVFSWLHSRKDSFFILANSKVSKVITFTYIDIIKNSIYKLIKLLFKPNIFYNEMIYPYLESRIYKYVAL